MSPSAWKRATAHSLRLVCLSAETADLCARLGAWSDVVAVTAYASQAGLEPRPIACGFSSGGVERIVSFAPDLVLGFSDVQAPLAEQLIRRGLNVLITNQRTLQETRFAMGVVARAIDRGGELAPILAEFDAALDCLRNAAGRPWRVYFEEWPNPMVTGIAWVGELIELLGAEDVFANLRGTAAKERVVSVPEVEAANPEIVFASWCGKPVEKPSLERRLANTAAVKAGHVYPIESDVILQPGMRLIEGAQQMAAIFQKATSTAHCV